MSAISSAGAPSPQPLHHRLTWLCILASVLVSNVVGVIGVENPLTPKAYALSYWEKHVTSGLPKSKFLMDKASPLTAAQYAAFSKIADDQNALSVHMPELCSQANLMCFPNSAGSATEKTSDINFHRYNHYRPGSTDDHQQEDAKLVAKDISFHGYHQKGGHKMEDEIKPEAIKDISFHRYHQHGGHKMEDEIKPEAVQDISFHRYHQKGGHKMEDEIKPEAVKDISFNHYHQKGGHKQEEEVKPEVTDISFSRYHQKGGHKKEEVKPDISFTHYHQKGGHKEEFTAAQLVDIGFRHYNHYHKDSQVDAARGVDTDIRFKRYNHYKKETGDSKKVTNWVPPGIFFREATLKPGAEITMPDFTDKKPGRSFLPRAIVSKLPFASSKLPDIKKIFHAGNDSSMSKMFTEALEDCEREPNVGETKRCVASIEGMVDFATLVLGQKVVARTMENKAGSNTNVLLGDVKPINGGRLTKSVSCHQSLYPYLLYYCHSVNGIRVYEADILDAKTKSKINHAVAICHEDTSSWSADHAAFVSLGSSPGKIEVCHWIFENDLTWVIAD